MPLFQYRLLYTELGNLHCNTDINSNFTHMIMIITILSFITFVLLEKRIEKKNQSKMFRTWT